MAKTSSFTVTTSWQAIQMNSEDIKDGTYCIFSKDSSRIGVVIGDVLPTDSNGDVWLEEKEKVMKFDLSPGDRWYVKTDTGTAIISVVRT